MKNTINLLFSVDDAFVKQLMTVLLSARVNTCHSNITAYVLSNGKLDREEALINFGESIGVTVKPVPIQEDIFKDAPANTRWPESIYYRLLAHDYLPDTLDRILYLDADILILNDLSKLYHLDMKGYMYAASRHTALKNLVTTVNKVRLSTYDSEGYFNSGVLLMDLKLKRQYVRRDDIYNYIKENRDYLLLPDQDVLNGLYGKYTLSIPDEKYNYDARYPYIYDMASNFTYDLDNVIEQTVVLHFCGKEKPWLYNYTTRFSALYKHYAHWTERLLKKQAK